ncbi:MAG: FeoA family protein [Clostridia bacterium]
MSVLYEVENNKTYIVTKALELPLLSSLGVYEGSVVEKCTTYKHGGPVLLLIEKREVAVGRDIAVQIEVEEYKGEE